MVCTDRDDEMAMKEKSTARVSKFIITDYKLSPDMYRKLHEVCVMCHIVLYGNKVP